MNEPATKIESLLAGQRSDLPVQLRQEVMETIRQTSLEQTRRDDRRMIVTSLASLILIALIFGVITAWQYSVIVKTIASLGFIVCRFPV